MYGITKQSPVVISDFWLGLPDDVTHVDAVYERKNDHMVVFIIGG